MDLEISLQQWWQEFKKTAMFNPLFLVFFLLLSVVFYLLMLAKREKLNLPPSPPKLPIIGNLHQLGRQIHRSLRDLSNKYGPLMLLHLGTAPTLVVSSAEVAQEIIKTHDVAFSHRPQTRAAHVFFCGCCDLAFSPHGEYWRQVKKICVRELLSQKRVQEFKFVRDEEVERMVEKVRLSCCNGASIDLSDLILGISNNVIARSVLGQVYEKGVGDKSFGALSRRTIDLIGSFCFKDLFPFLGWMDVVTGLVTSLKSTSTALHDFLDRVIEEHQLSRNVDHNKSEMKDFVDILLHLQQEGMLDLDLSGDNFKAILMDMFVAGTDTTASTMEWAMAELVRNPRVMKKAQEEVRKLARCRSRISEADINEMVYLKSVLKETLRLHAVALIARETTESVKLKGYDIACGTRVLINTWAIQRDPKVWDRPEEFIPERFQLRDSSAVDFRGQYHQFIPFGAGRRICPGISFAVAEAELVLANLLCWFDWELPDGSRPEDLDMEETNSLVVHKKTPLILVPLMHSPL